MINIDWDSRFSKHYVRRDGWLPAIVQFKTSTKKSVIKYFTLCDVQAIDIFMLEKNDILKRDSKGKLPNVVICEGDRSKVADINALVRPPVKEAIIPEKIEDLFTFEEDDYTRNTPVHTYERDRLKRKRLHLKDHYERVKKAFPFDVINFDPCNSMLNEEIKANQLCKALERIFVLQKSTNQFLLFVTTSISDIDKSVTDKFTRNLAENVAKYQQLKDTLVEHLGHSEYEKIIEPYRTSICFIKSIMFQIAKRQGWYFEHKGIFTYENANNTKMLASVASCTLVGKDTEESVYVNDIIGIIQGKVKYHSYLESLNDINIQTNLKEIIEYRECVRKIST